MFWLGLYLGCSILVSLHIPPNENVHGEYIDEIPASTRVVVGLMWPLYYVLRYINRR